MERQDRYINVEKMLQEIGILSPNYASLYTNPLIEVYRCDTRGLSFSFSYHKDRYFFKHSRLWSGDIVDPYGELIAEELAHDFGISCVEYDLAVFGNHHGVISKDFRKPGVRYLLGKDIFHSFLDYYDTNLEGELVKYRHIPENVLEDIWDELEIRYHGNREIVSHLMKGIVNIYLFDIITCQIDRHEENWEIMESSDGVDIDIAPIYDNERILLDTEEDAEVCLGMNFSMSDTEKLFESIQRFLGVSSTEFFNIISEKLWIIGEENLLSIFERIEKKTKYPMPETTKKYYLEAYQKHFKHLLNILELVKERDGHNERKN